VGGRSLLVVLTGPSGAGKDSVLDRFRTLKGDRYAVAVNATTRPPRAAEQEGVDYFFVSKEEFSRMVAEGEMLEHAVVYGQDKGVPKGPVRELLQAGRTVLLRTDIQGARFIKATVPGAVTIFIAPPSNEELEFRLRNRDTDTQAQVALRLETARREMAAAGEFDYVVVNDDLERCVAEVEEIIGSEAARPGAEPVRVE
jgi:guanylate kinase